VARRVLFIIREESQNLEAKKKEGQVAAPTAHTMLSSHMSLSDIFGGQRTRSNPDAVGSAANDLKGSIIEVINEVIDELETFYNSISAQALEHIHSKYVPLRFPHFFIWKSICRC